MADTITGLSVSSCVIHLKFYKYGKNNKKTGKAIDLGMIPAKHIQKMQHQLRADGHANSLSISLVHMFDPYEKYKDDLKNLEYIPLALSQGFGNLEFSYGYAMSDGTYDMAGPFDMMVTSLKESYMLNGIRYEMSAVSTIAVTDQVDGAEEVVAGSKGTISTAVKSYNWLSDPEKRVKHYKNSDASAVFKFGTQAVRLTDIAKCIISGYNGQEGKIGYKTKVYFDSDLFPSILNYTGGDNSTVAEGLYDQLADYRNLLIQTGVSDLSYANTILQSAFHYIGQEGKTVYTGDPNARNPYVTTMYNTYYVGYTMSINDHRKEAYIYPTYKVYRNPSTGSIDIKESFNNEELNKLKQLAGVEIASHEIKSVPDRTFYWGGSKGWEEQKDDKKITVSDVISFDIDFDAIAAMLTTKGSLESKGVSGYGEITDSGRVTQSSLSQAQDYSGSGMNSAPGSMMWATSLDAYSKIAQILPVAGTLKTMGDTDDLKIMSQFKIGILVDGKSSVASGIYRVISKIDNISEGGLFTSSYSLTKIADDNKNYTFSEQYKLSE